MAARAVGGKPPPRCAAHPWVGRPVSSASRWGGHDHAGLRPFADRPPRIPYLDHPEEAWLPVPSSRAAFPCPTTLDDVAP